MQPTIYDFIIINYDYSNKNLQSKYSQCKLPPSEWILILAHYCYLINNYIKSLFYKIHYKTKNILFYIYHLFYFNLNPENEFISITDYWFIEWLTEMKNFFIFHIITPRIYSNLIQDIFFYISNIKNYILCNIMYILWSIQPLLPPTVFIKYSLLLCLCYILLFFIILSYFNKNKITIPWKLIHSLNNNNYNINNQQYQPDLNQKIKWFDSKSLSPSLFVHNNNNTSTSELKLQQNSSLLITPISKYLNNIKNINDNKKENLSENNSLVLSSSTMTDNHHNNHRYENIINSHDNNNLIENENNNLISSTEKNISDINDHNDNVDNSNESDNNNNHEWLGPNI